MKKLKEKHAAQKAEQAGANSGSAEEKQQTAASGDAEAGKTEEQESAPVTLEMLAQQMAALTRVVKEIHENMNGSKKDGEAGEGKENAQEKTSETREGERAEGENPETLKETQNEASPEGEGGGAVSVPEGGGGLSPAANSSAGGGAVPIQGGGGAVPASVSGGGGNEAVAGNGEAGVAYKSPDSNPMLQGSRAESVTAELVERARREGYRVGRLQAIEESRRERVAYYQNLLDAGARAEGRMPQSRPTGQFLASPRRGFWEE